MQSLTVPPKLKFHPAKITVGTKMKRSAKTWIHLVAAGFVSLPIAVSAQPSEPLCRAKYDAINTQLTAATAQGQSHRARGLRRALDEVSLRCTDGKLKSEYAQRLRKQEREVAERQRELAKAQAEGRAEKVARRKNKLQEAQDQLQRLRAAGPS